MALSEVVVRELKEELADMRGRRDVIDARIGAIELLLTEGKVTTLVPGADGQRRGRARRLLRAVRPRRGSLRTRLLQMLGQAALTGAEITRQLEADQFRVGGKARLRERVAHELSRLRRLGVLRKSPTGHYHVAQPSSAPSPSSTPQEGSSHNHEQRLNDAVVVEAGV